MFSLRRKAVQTAERFPVASTRTARQYSTAQHGKTGDKVHHVAGPSKEHGHHHAGPVNESLGTGFYLTMAVIPISLGVYALSRPDKDGKAPGFTRFIDSYSHYREKWAARNTLHTAAIEQAGFNKNLYRNATPSKHVELRFPEIFNTGAPHNVVAGQGSRDMDALVAHYQKVNLDEEERKVKVTAAKSS